VNYKGLCTTAFYDKRAYIKNLEVFSHNQGTNDLKITEALCPPNPKVLLKAALTFRCCATLKVKFNLGSSWGSSVKWLMVGGIRPSRILLMAAMDSTAPAAPSRCPVMDLVELIFNAYAASPNTC